MSKKDTTYADAMNEWAEKRSAILHRRNRFIHPSPNLPAPLQALGYLARIAIVLFLLWAAVAIIAKKYYSGERFNERMQAELKSILKADELTATSFSFQRKKGICKKITARGSEEAFYRSLGAERLAFKLPLLKRIRPAWEIEQLRIEELDLELRSGGKSRERVGAVAPGRDAIPLIAAGLFSGPDLKRLSIRRISCAKADIRWGLSSATSGAVDGASLEFFGSSPNWRLDFSGGTIRQNWLHDLEIESLTVHRQDDKLVLSNSDIRLGTSTETGTLEGQVTLETLPKFDLKLNLPKADTRDLFPSDLNIPDYFYGSLKLELGITGSTNTRGGIKTSGKATLTNGTFNKIPVLEAIDYLLKTSNFRIFSPDYGKVEFTTGGGQLMVSHFECKSKASRSILRGEFTYTPAAALGQANSPAQLGGTELARRTRAQIEGMLQFGVRPSVLSDNALAKTFFKERGDGYVWIDIPLEGPVGEATKKQQASILTALKGEGD